MGCSHSKDIKSPSKGIKGPSWNRVLNRLISVHVDRSIETKDEGYIAAVFSAKCGITSNPVPAKILEKRASMPKSSAKGTDAQAKDSGGEGRKNKHVRKESRGDTVVGIPVLHTNHEPKSLAASKSIESACESLETINIFELMEGLAEDEVSANFHLRHAISEPSMPMIQVSDGQKIAPGSSIHDAHIQGALSGKLSTRRARPKSFSSFKSLEDVDRVLSARRSEMASTDSTAHFHILMSEANSSTAETRGPHFDVNSTRDPDISLRALSFKYMFNDSCDKEHDFLFSTVPSASFIKDRDARVGCRNDLLLTPARRLWCDGDGFGASAEFSPASLKDWLPSRNPPGCLKEGSELSILGTFQISQLYTAEEGARLECFDSPEEAQFACVQEVSNESSSMCQYQQGTADLSSGVQEFGSPVFDPEMLESFETAMKHLSKEEWDAVRGMEDSPRKFLRLVKALKKSSSNNHAAFKDSVHAQTDPGFVAANAKHVMGMDSTKDQCGGAGKLLDVKLKTLCLEKKLAYMRQNSLQVRRALANASLEDDTEGGGMVVFYSTTSRANAKMYEDCNHVRSILHSVMGVSYVERSISEFLEHEQKLRHVLNVSTVVVPTIYVKGKCLVGVDSILQLYKKGLLGAMLQVVVPFVPNSGSMHCSCREGRFLVCSVCKGRCKLSRGTSEGMALCRYCSGAGLIECLKCSCA